MLRRCILRFCPSQQQQQQLWQREKRAHTKIILWGTFAASPLPRRVSPTEIRITNLPPRPSSSADIDGIESDWNFVAVAAGSRHIALLTAEGHLVLIGSNKHGQIGRDTSETIPENEPQFFDFGWACPETEAPNALACGTNYTIAYRRGGDRPRAVVVGFNNAGQLGLGHKEILDNLDGVPEWRHDASWWASSSSSSLTSSSPAASASTPPAQIEHIECGYNHTLMFLRDGRVFACGTNQWGELGLGRGITDSPMHPEPLPFFASSSSSSSTSSSSSARQPPQQAEVKVKQCSAGNSFSLFLSEEGRVFGCGSGSRGQLPFATQEPTVVPVSRDSRPRLIRIGAISAGGDHTVLVSAVKTKKKKKSRKSNDGANSSAFADDDAATEQAAEVTASGGEIFFLGSLPDVGVIDASGAMREISRGDAVAPFLHMKSHGSSTVIVDGDGNLWGLGSNTEGQLGVWKEANKNVGADEDGDEEGAGDAAESQCGKSTASAAEEKAQEKPTGKKEPLFETPDGFAITSIDPEYNPFLTAGIDVALHKRSTAPAPLLAVTELKRIGGIVKRKNAVTSSMISWRDRLAVGNGFAVMLDPDDEYDVSPSEEGFVLMPPLLPKKKSATMADEPAPARRKLKFKW